MFEKENIHRLVDLSGRELAMYGLHGVARPLHRHEGLLVDICRLDRVHLLLDGPDVVQRLLEVVFVDLLAP
jgi:hypothetical protein